MLAEERAATTRPAGATTPTSLVNTPVSSRWSDTARLLVQLNRHQVSARRGVIVSGPSGTGKTTALTQLGRTHERHTRKRYPGGDHRLPVVYVTVPPAATARMLAVEFARFIGLAVNARQKHRRHHQRGLRHACPAQGRAGLRR